MVFRTSEGVHNLSNIDVDLKYVFDLVLNKIFRLDFGSEFECLMIVGVNYIIIMEIILVTQLFLRCERERVT